MIATKHTAQFSTLMSNGHVRFLLDILVVYDTQKS